MSIASYLKLSPTASVCFKYDVIDIRIRNVCMIQNSGVARHLDWGMAILEAKSKQNDLDTDFN